MSELVPADEIEQIVGARRHPHQHLGRAVSAEQIVYILHSEQCRDSGIDLRDCAYSKALDNGIDLEWWVKHQDRAVVVAPFHSRLLPLTPEWLADLLLPTTPPAPESATPYPVVAEAPGMATMSDSREGATEASACVEGGGEL